MDIRVKIGRRAGEICDIAPEAARAMLADGRAERAYPDRLPAPEPIPAPVFVGKSPNRARKDTAAK